MFQPSADQSGADTQTLQPWRRRNKDMFCSEVPLEVTYKQWILREMSRNTNIREIVSPAEIFGELDNQLGCTQLKTGRDAGRPFEIKLLEDQVRIGLKAIRRDILAENAEKIRGTA